MLIELTNIIKKETSITFKFTGLSTLFPKNEITVAYDTTLPSLQDNTLVNMFCSFTLSIATAKIDKNITVKTKYNVTQKTEDFWNFYLNKVKQCPKQDIKIKSEAPKTYAIDWISSPFEKSSVALFYGGGVEGNYALAKLEPLNPRLIIFEGHDFMNNKINKHDIKENLLKQLSKEKELAYNKITIPFRNKAYTTFTESEMNNHITGLFFYFLSLSLCLKYNISIMFDGQESEDLPKFHSHYFWDYSLSYHLMSNVNIQSGPIVQNIGGYISKANMTYLLYHLHSDYYKYIYSCLGCTDKRWCGICEKCHRLAYYCETLKLNKTLLGMEETQPSNKISPKYKTPCDEFVNKLGI